VPTRFQFKKNRKIGSVFPNANGLTRSCTSSDPKYNYGSLETGVAEAQAEAETGENGYLCPDGV